jgi:hypothetical protein
VTRIESERAIIIKELSSTECNRVPEEPRGINA